MKNNYIKIFISSTLITITFALPFKASDYIEYNENSHALTTKRAASSELVIGKINDLERNHKTIKSVILSDNGMIDNNILDYLENNVNSLTFLNITNTPNIKKEAVDQFKERRPEVKVIYN